MTERCQTQRPFVCPAEDRTRAKWSRLSQQRFPLGERARGSGGSRVKPRGARALFENTHRAAPSFLFLCAVGVECSIKPPGRPVRTGPASWFGIGCDWCRLGRPAAASVGVSVGPCLVSSPAAPVSPTRCRRFPDAPDFGDLFTSPHPTVVLPVDAGA